MYIFFPFWSFVLLLLWLYGAVFNVISILCNQIGILYELRLWDIKLYLVLLMADQRNSTIHLYHKIFWHTQELRMSFFFVSLEIRLVVTVHCQYYNKNNLCGIRYLVFILIFKWITHSPWISLPIGWLSDILDISFLWSCDSTCNDYVSYQKG